jgi:hypothetical protein
MVLMEAVMEFERNVSRQHPGQVRELNANKAAPREWRTVREADVARQVALRPAEDDFEHSRPSDACFAMAKQERTSAAQLTIEIRPTRSSGCQRRRRLLSCGSDTLRGARGLYATLRSDMHSVQLPRHPGDMDLTWEQVRDGLAALEGSRVAVRVVERSDPEMLLAVFQGDLGALDRAKHPALFWPVYLSGGQRSADEQDIEVDFQRDGDHIEDVGFYLRRDRFEGAVGRAGCTVLVIIQGPVLINIRRS